MRLRTQAPVDVCVVGSGAGGGMTAYALTRAGLNVTVLEAGRRIATGTLAEVAADEAVRTAYLGRQSL